MRAAAREAKMPETDSISDGSAVQRRRRAIVFADLVESVRLMHRNEADTIERWRGFVAQVRIDLAASRDGRLVRTAGDALLLDFDAAADAVRAGFAMHDAIAAQNTGRPPEEAMALRVGIHVAPVLFDESEAYGDGVNLAARLSTLAQPAQTVVSTAARDGLVDGLHARVHDLGPRYVKHLDEPVRAFRVDPIGGPERRQAHLPSAAIEEDLRPAVAVVPFAAIPEDPAHDAVGFAIADDVIASLSRHAGLRVLSRASTAALRRPQPDIALVRSLLGSPYLLTGHFYAFGDRVRLHVELCRSSDATVLWAGSAAAHIGALFMGEDQLVPEIVANVGRCVLAEELARARSLPLDSLASYTLYLGACGLLNSLVHADFMRAREILQHLVDRHPRLAAPHATLARWHVFRTVQGWADDPQREAAAAKEQALRAIEIDPGHACALATFGLARMSFDHDIDAARHSYEAAVAADPQEPHAWANFSAVHSHCGEHDAACASAQRALALSPLDPNRFLFEAFAAMATLGAERFTEAVAHAQASIRLHALHAPSHRLLVAALWLAGQQDEARAAAARYLSIQPTATVGKQWRVSRGTQPVWGGRFAEALRAAGVPA